MGMGVWGKLGIGLKRGVGGKWGGRWRIGVGWWRSFRVCWSWWGSRLSLDWEVRGGMC